MNADDLLALKLTAQLAGATTLLLLLLGTPLAWWLARTRSRLKPFVGALVALPLVLPPTALGFYLLLALGPQGPVGSVMVSLGLQPLPFSFAGLVVASVLSSLPFAVQPLQTAFEGLSNETLEAAATLRAGPWDRFVSIVLPICAPGFLAAAVLGFAHTVGEFGIVLMMGGNIPGQTRTLSIAIYDHVESMAHDRAHVLAGTLLAFSLAVLLLMQGLARRQQRVWR